MPQENYLFLGNPGTGKSTLINCLVSEQVFDSGVSYGSGLTQFFQKHYYNGIVYMDTPGLADRKIQERAAAAITQALKETGRYKLFFMVRLENGRVVSDDLVTIETVMASIDMKDVPFSIIVNNVKKRQYAKMMEKGEEFWKVVTMINSIKYTTPHIVFIPVLASLEEEDNAYTDLPGNVKSFIRNDALTVVIAPEAVNTIKAADFKRLVDELREELERLRTDNAALRQRMDELMEQPGFFRNVGKSIDSPVGSVVGFFCNEHEADAPQTGSQTCGRCRTCQSKLRDDSDLCENCRSVSETHVGGNTLCPECDRNIFSNEEFCRTCGYFLVTNAIFA
ncbi:hypothetical protein BBJ28_00016471 [Nothophytophthora sp. Chile5]|nr:hypothetical protein BBJ28_00016471 [Nothophytophthora sp. Chile5]